jgi:hypothetical protein
VVSKNFDKQQKNADGIGTNAAVYRAVERPLLNIEAISSAIISTSGILREPNFRCNVDKAPGHQVTLAGFVELL